MRVLGVDTGRWVGWAVLESRIAAHGGGFDYVAAGVLDLEEIGEAAVVLELQALALAHRVTRAGVERVTRVQEHAVVSRAAMASQASNIANASWLGGEFAGTLRADGLEVRHFAAEQVRAHFIVGVGPVEAQRHKAAGKALDMDGAVAEVVRQRVAGWPARLPGAGAAYRKDGADLLADKRSHAHDATLVALYAAQVAP